MSSWKVTAESVSELKKLSAELAHMSENLNTLYENLYNEFENQKDGLGKHSNSIGELINDIQDINQDVNRISGKLQIKLNKAAMIREKSINDNPYSGVASGVTAAGVAGGIAAGVSASAPSGSSGVASGSAGSGTGNSTPSGAPSVDERTIFELESFMEEMEFSDGDSSIIQRGGAHKDVTKTISGQEYESHHIPARSVFSDNANELPTIALTKDDHAKTSSFRGRMRKKYKPFIPTNAEIPSHKGSIQEKVDEGFLAEMIKDEIYEIKDAFGDKYDGAIKQYISAMIEYIKKNGTPKT